VERVVTEEKSFGVSAKDGETFPMITAVKIENYKNLEGEFLLSPITVIVGPNGGGKTALFEVMSLFSNLAMAGGPKEDKMIDALLRGRVGPTGFGGAVRNMDFDKQITMGIEWNDRTSYELKLQWLHEHSLTVPVNEIFIYKGERKLTTSDILRVMWYGAYQYEYNLGKTRSALTTGAFPIALARNFHPEDKALRDLRDRLCGWRFYRFNVRDLCREWKALSLNISNELLLIDGSNIAQVLHRLKDSADESENEIWEIIESRIGEATGGRFKVSIDKDKGIIWPQLKFEKHSIPLGFWPDGWKSYLLMLTALYTAKSLVFIEEPESFMHPELLNLLVSEARTLSEDRGLQFIFTTHSTSFVNLFSYKEVCLMESGKLLHLKPGKWMEEVGLSIGDALATGLIKEAAQGELGSGDNRDN